MTAAHRQHESAQHYLHKPYEHTALQAAVGLIGEHFDFPMVQVNVLDRVEQHTIAAIGTALGSRPRTESLCDQVVRDGAPKQLADLDPNLVAATHWRAYVGVPIAGREGLVIGALCLLDTVPRHVDQTHLRQLILAATVVRDQLELLRRLEPTAAGSNAEALALAGAVDAGQIVPHYQPIVRISDETVVAVEALARWDHPELGLLPPSSFLPLAEDTDIIIDLDVAILRQAAQDLARWARRYPALQLSVNLSARHFDHPDCVQRLTATVLEAGADPASVGFEVTETVALAGHVDDRSFLHDLRQTGFRVLLDDFGTGFSSLDQLLHLPIDGIKLDRSLSAALATPAGKAITRALLILADELHLHVVVEGIETAAQATDVHALGGRFGQGYLWSAALPAKIFEAEFLG